jgi:hypothetical protein
MRDIRIYQMENEGRVEKDSGKKVGCAEVRHFRDGWEFSRIVSGSVGITSGVLTETFRLIYSSSQFGTAGLWLKDNKWLSAENAESVETKSLCGVQDLLLVLLRVAQDITVAKTTIIFCATRGSSLGE